MLRLEALHKRYATGEVALTGVDLEVIKGQVMALIGPSGAGKSTLIRCVNRLVPPSGGRTFFINEDVTRLSSRKLLKMRRQMGMIFQEFALVERLSVMENVLSGRLGVRPVQTPEKSSPFVGAFLAVCDCLNESHPRC